MRILVLDAALARCAAAVVADGAVLAERLVQGGRGHPAALAPMVRDVCAEADLRPGQMDAVAVTVGPGSFTGLRAALSLAHGLAAAAGCPVVAVTVAEALAHALPHLGGRALWVAIDSRRGRVFLQRPDHPLESVALDSLPPAGGFVAVAGDAASTVAAWLAARGDDITLSDARLPAPAHIADVALGRLSGDLPPLAAQPLYVDPPEAKLPAGGLRPAPVG